MCQSKATQSGLFAITISYPDKPEKNRKDLEEITSNSLFRVCAV
jgi:hypothetical protein